MADRQYRAFIAFQRASPWGLDCSGAPNASVMVTLRVSSQNARRLLAIMSGIFVNSVTLQYIPTSTIRKACLLRPAAARYGGVRAAR